MEGTRPRGVPLNRDQRYKGRVQDFRKLKVWQRSRVVVNGVYQITESFPTTERYGLVSQSRRAAVSIAANIAEGCGRFGSREFSRFVNIALGSAAELESHLLVAAFLQMTSEEAVGPVMAELKQVQRMLASLARRLVEDSPS
jgi:four helix bundle protein